MVPCITINTMVVDNSWVHMEVSWNRDSPEVSILRGFFIKNHPFWLPPFSGNLPMFNNQILRSLRDREPVNAGCATLVRPWDLGARCHFPDASVFERVKKWGPQWEGAINGSICRSPKAGRSANTWGLFSGHFNRLRWKIAVWLFSWWSTYPMVIFQTLKYQKDPEGLFPQQKVENMKWQ